MQFIRNLLGVRERPCQEVSRGSLQDRDVGLLCPRVGWATDVGIQRSNNEDSVLVIAATQEGNQVSLDFGFFVVADGMGGHRGGEVASSVATRTVTEHVIRHFCLPCLALPAHRVDQLSLNEMLVEAVQLANVRVQERVPGAGTTLTCALLVGRRAYIAHVGDSRAYLVHDGTTEQLTQDHSLVDRLVELGQLTPDEAASHPQKNVLYRAVGQGGVLDVDTFAQDIPEGGCLLICTDGLWGMVSDADIAQIVADYPDPQSACEGLIVAANKAGGRDNITAAIAVPR